MSGYAGGTSRSIGASPPAISLYCLFGAACVWGGFSIDEPRLVGDVSAYIEQNEENNCSLILAGVCLGTPAHPDMQAYT